MLFTLEALSARHGDALLLHYGSATAPRLAVIDGGPGGVYRETLRPRLLELRSSRTPGAPLTIDLLMVSHLDDDHINGVLELAGEVLEAKDSDQVLPYAVRGLWFNSFDDVIGNRESDHADRATELGAVLPASVKQGRELRDRFAKVLSVPVNRPFRGLVAAGLPESRAEFAGGLELTVVAPSSGRLRALERDWDTFLSERHDAIDLGRAQAAAYLDQAVFNLSSIVVVVRSAGKTMLLTGDARGDDILAGLATAGALTDGKLHVDLLKLPHHGSDRNVATAFFRAITADHYVISADGRHGNPEVATLEMIRSARGADAYTLWLTSREPRLADYFTSRPGNYTVMYRADADLSLRVELGDERLTE